MSGRNSQVSRIYKLLTLLENAPHGLTAQELRGRMEDRGFEVSQRTIYRDLDALRGAGFPLDEKVSDGNEGSRWTLDRTTKIHQHLVINSREILALCLAKGTLLPLQATPFYADLTSFFNKIEEKFGEKNRAFMAEIVNEIHFEPGPVWGLGISPEIIDTIMAACSERQWLSIVYYSANSGETTERRVGPQFLYYSKGALYFVAEDRGDGVIKHFSVARIQKATLLEEPYDAAIQDPKTYFAGSFGVYRGDKTESVKLLFDRKIASYIKERKWHPSQQTIVRNQGVVELNLEVAITPELVQWVLGFGPNVTIKEPISLKDKIQEQAEATLQLYHKRVS